MKRKFSSSAPVQGNLNPTQFWQLCKKVIINQCSFSNMPETSDAEVYFKYSEDHASAWFISVGSCSGLRLVFRDHREEYYLKDKYIYSRIYSDSEEYMTTCSPSLISSAVEAFPWKDGSLYLGDKIHYWGEDYLYEIADIVNGKQQFSMPIIYMTRQFWNRETVLTAERVADRYRGIAHVIVEADSHLPKKILAETGAKAPYNGCIMIAFPGGFYKRFMPERFHSIDDLENAIWEAMTSRMAKYYTRPEFSWTELEKDHINSKYIDLRKMMKNILSDRKSTEEYVAELNQMREYVATLEDLNARRSQELEEERSNWDEERQFYDEYVTSLEADNAKKDRIISGYRSKGNDDGGEISITLKCREPELYESEIYDYLLELIEKEKNCVANYNQKTRRSQAILSGILNANEKTGARDNLRNELKSTLHGIRNLSAPERRKLISLGFTLQDDGKHIVMKYGGDDRYMAVFAKTGSDHRGMMNAFTDLDTKLFG